MTILPKIFPFNASLCSKWSLLTPPPQSKSNIKHQTFSRWGKKTLASRVGSFELVNCFTLVAPEPYSGVVALAPHPPEGSWFCGRWNPKTLNHELYWNKDPCESEPESSKAHRGLQGHSEPAPTSAPLRMDDMWSGTVFCWVPLPYLTMVISSVGLVTTYQLGR